MSDFGLSVLAFLKLAKVLDPNAASYHDINMEILVETFGVFFEGHDQEKLEMGSRVRSMVRWLCKQAPKEVVTQINSDKLLTCDPDEIEKVAILMFYCKKKEQPEQFLELLNQLDDHDRKVLIGATEDDHKEKIQRVARNIRVFVDALRQYSVVNAQREELLAEEKKRGSVDDMVEEQQEKMQQRIRRDQEALEEMKSINEQLRRENEVPLPESGTPIRDLRATLVRLNAEIDSVRSEADGLRGKVENINEMRERRSLGNMSKEEMRQELLNLGRAKARQKATIEEKRKHFASKCKNLDSSIREFVEKKQTLRDRVVSNMLDLKHDKQSGITRDKITLINTLRKKREELKLKIEKKRVEVAHFQQMIDDGKFPIYA